MRSLILAAVALLLAACSLEYRASVPPVEDEVVVQAVSTAQAAYDHPVRLSEQDLTIFSKASGFSSRRHWLQRLLTDPSSPYRSSTGPRWRSGAAIAAAMGKAGNARADRLLTWR